ncbi:MAG: efflux RND transporter periplasmic adaptor subunit [Acidobacteria bacterium]|nr:efflux RND transporter periplasmic adaptor subunit [Acidobacteriota bacterium]
MHPRIVLASLLLLSTFLAGCNKQAAPVQTKKDSGPLAVRMTDVKVRDITRVVETTGTLFPFEEAVISAEIDGKAEDVRFDLGDIVEKGQVLVRINDEEQRYQVQQSEAQLRQSLERLGLKTENDKVADVRETPDVRRSKADLTEAEQRFKRTRQLVDQNIGAKSELDQASSRFQAAQAAYDATINQTRNLIQEVERFRANLEIQRKKLRDTTVKSPFRAIVKERQVSLGQFVRTNTPLFVLVKIDPIRLRIEIPERMAPWIKINQLADVSLEAFEGRKFVGRIWRISPTVDQSKRTFVAEALIDNKIGELKPGSYAKARLPTSKSERILVIPQRAVYYVLGSNKAFVVKDGVIDSRDVRLGDRIDQDVEILEGLADGDRIAISQLPRLDSGVKVKLAPDAPAKTEVAAKKEGAEQAAQPKPQTGPPAN